MLKTTELLIIYTQITTNNQQNITLFTPNKPQKKALLCKDVFYIKEHYRQKPLDFLTKYCYYISNKWAKIQIMANIIAIKNNLTQRVRTRRREGKISQAELARRSGVSFASIRRFESTGEISLTSLFRIAVALGYESDFNKLFARKNYQSLDEIINAK